MGNDQKYVSLYKLFYSAPAEYEAAFQRRFNDAETLHLPDVFGTRKMFVCQCAEISRLEQHIQNEDFAVRQLRKVLPSLALKQFARRCLVDELVVTNDIEGVVSTRKEMYDVMDCARENTGKAKGRFFGLVQKYLLLQRNESVRFVTCKDVRELYDELVLPEVAKEDAANVPDGVFFRKNHVSVMSPSQKEIHSGLFPESSIIRAVQASLDFLNSDCADWLVRISVFHYLFGFIHPFYDGNGRTSRFISSALLSRELDSLIGYRLSYTVKESIAQYNRAFRICNDVRNRGDLTPFVLTFLGIVNEATERLHEALQRRYAELEFFTAKLNTNAVFSSPDVRPVAEQLLHAALFSEGGISCEDLLEVTGLNNEAIERALIRLDEAGWLVSEHDDEKTYLRLCVS